MITAINLYLNYQAEETNGIQTSLKQSVNKLKVIKMMYSFLKIMPFQVIKTCLSHFETYDHLILEKLLW